MQKHSFCFILAEAPLNDGSPTFKAILTWNSTCIRVLGRLALPWGAPGWRLDLPPAGRCVAAHCDTICSSELEPKLRAAKLWSLRLADAEILVLELEFRVGFMNSYSELHSCRRSETHIMWFTIAISGKITLVTFGDENWRDKYMHKKELFVLECSTNSTFVFCVSEPQVNPNRLQTTCIRLWSSSATRSLSLFYQWSTITLFVF